MNMSSSEPPRSPSPALSYTSSVSSMMDVEGELLIDEPVVHHYCNPLLLIPGGGPVTYLSGPFYVVLMHDIVNIVSFDFRDAALQLKQKGAIVDAFFTLEDAKLAYKWICREVHPCQPHSDDRDYRRSLIEYLRNDPSSYTGSPLPPPRSLLPQDDDESLPSSEISDGSPMPSTPSDPISPPLSSLPSSDDHGTDDDPIIDDSRADEPDETLNETTTQNHHADRVASQYEDLYASHNIVSHNDHFSFSLLMAQDSESGYESDSSTMASIQDSLRYPTPDNPGNPPTGRGPYHLVRMEDHRSVLFCNQSVALLIFAETYKKMRYGDILSSHGVTNSIDSIVRNSETRLFYAVRGEFIKRYFSDRYLAQQFFDDEARTWSFVDMLISTVRDEARQFAGLI